MASPGVARRARVPTVRSLTEDAMGPLSGVRIIELAGIGPGPFCAMMLADMGADVIRVERSSAVRGGNPDVPPADVMLRGRRSIGVDMKSSEGIETVMRLVESADGLIEGFRPGVTERLGVGPDDCLARNPRLVYGRMTGWGQEGPYAQAAGHDINYIALAGALDSMGRQGEAPVPPLNLVGDFGGGGMYLAFGMVCALLEARSSGEGQVVDAAMVDGAASLMTFFHGFRAMGIWNDERGTNLLDTGAHFYDVYECADGNFVSIGSIEPQFYAVLREKMELADPMWDQQMSRSAWPDLKTELMRVSKRRPRRVVRDHGAHRHLLRSGVVDGGGPTAPAQHRPRHVRRAQRCDTATAGAPLLSHRLRDSTSARSRRPAHR